MRGRWAIYLSTLIVLVGLGKTASAWSQERQPPQRNFDYWQPDWMVRGLWGPGSMPKSMMVRLLRHTTYMQYGVSKSYEGAKSTVPPGPQTIAAGRKLYGEHCALVRLHGIPRCVRFETSNLPGFALGDLDERQVGTAPALSGQRRGEQRKSHAR